GFLETPLIADLPIEGFHCLRLSRSGWWQSTWTYSTVGPAQFRDHAAHNANVMDIGSWAASRACKDPLAPSSPTLEEHVRSGSGGVTRSMLNATS
ncbi:unnamed protein product, partial [Penicillium manginii]